MDIYDILKGVGNNPLAGIIERTVVGGIRRLAIYLGVYIEPEEPPKLVTVRVPSVVEFEGIKRSCVVKRLLDSFGRVVETYYLFPGGDPYGTSFFSPLYHYPTHNPSAPGKSSPAEFIQFL